MLHTNEEKKHMTERDTHFHDFTSLTIASETWYGDSQAMLRRIIIIMAKSYEEKKQNTILINRLKYFVHEYSKENSSKTKGREKGHLVSSLNFKIKYAQTQLCYLLPLLPIHISMKHERYNHVHYSLPASTIVFTKVVDYSIIEAYIYIYIYWSQQRLEQIG